MDDIPPEVRAVAAALRNLQEPFGLYEEDHILEEGARRLLIELSKLGFRVEALRKDA